MGYRLGADIGGTFTDLVIAAPDGGYWTKKLSSTQDDLSRGIIEGMGQLLSEQDVAFESIEEIVHGTTVATNAILQDKGAKTALITTEGFRDVLELRRMRVPSLYSLLYAPPKPLVERHLRLEVTERVGADGEVLIPLDMDSVHAAINVILEEETEAVAVCLLHSYRYPDHERAVGEELQRMLPGVFVSLSVDVLPRNPRVRAHQHDRSQRLPRPHREVVHRLPRAAGQGRELGRSRADHAVERRHHVGPARRADSRPDAGVRSGRGRHRGGQSRQASRLEEHHHLRHGRHDGQGRPHRERLPQLHDRLRDRRGHLPVQQARDRRGPRREGARHRPCGGRRGRRKHRADRRRRSAQGRAKQRRVVSRPRMLQHRRRRTHRHRRKPRSRLHQPLVPGGRRSQADPVPGRIEYAVRRCRAARPVSAGRGARRSRRRQRQHDPCDPSRLNVPWPRPQGLRSLGIWRQRPHPRRRHGPLAQHRDGCRPAVTRTVLRRRSPPGPTGAPLRPHILHQRSGRRLRGDQPRVPGVRRPFNRLNGTRRATISPTSNGRGPSTSATPARPTS